MKDIAFMTGGLLEEVLKDLVGALQLENVVVHRTFEISNKK